MKNDLGYGRFMPSNTRTPVLAHVYAYERLIGPRPRGLDLHHTCENPGCVNPSHLEPLTRSEHVARHKKGER